MERMRVMGEDGMDEVATNYYSILRGWGCDGAKGLIPPVSRPSYGFLWSSQLTCWRFRLRPPTVSPPLAGWAVWATIELPALGPDKIPSVSAKPAAQWNGSVWWPHRKAIRSCENAQRTGGLTAYPAACVWSCEKKSPQVRTRGILSIS